MNREILTELKIWFEDYVDTFKQIDETISCNIILKEVHTKKVCNEILYIGKNIGLDGNDLQLAEAIALFHDIGRFEQYKRYGTFIDKNSVNHAELGVKILCEKEVLNILERSTRDLILRTILYHNRLKLPVDETKSCYFYTKLLRDADKLDIWRINIEYYGQKNRVRNYAIELDLPDSDDVSDSIYHCIMNMKNANIKDVKNINDFKLLQMGWVYDINYKPTLHRFKEQSYLNKYMDFLPNTEKVNNVFDKINSYLTEKII